MSKTFCPLPFNHLYIKPDGTNSPCCRFRNWEVSEGKSRTRTTPDNIKDYNTLNDVLNKSKWLGSIREKMLSNSKVPGCESCYVDEKNTGVSMRTMVLDEWKNVNIIEPVVTNIEITFGNYCNLACRTCGSSLSTSWQEDDKILSEHYPRAYVPEKLNVKKDWKPEDFKDVTSLKITGGEPLLHPDFPKFLDTVVESGVADRMIVQIFTNAHIMPKKYILDRLAKFKRVGIWLSIDGTHEKQNYIRHLSKWEQVEQTTISWLKFQNENPAVVINFAPTITLYNILNVEELFTWFLDLRDKILLDPLYWSNCTFNVTSWPTYIDIKNLPDKENIRDKLKKYRDKLSQREEYDTFIKLFGDIINRLDAPSEQEQLVEFTKINKDLDKLRNQKFTETFPELFSQIENIWNNNDGKL